MMKNSDEETGQGKERESARQFIISILGYYGYGNTGDEAILESIIALFNKFLSCKFIVFTENPEIVSNIHNVRAIYSSRTNMFKNIIEIIHNLFKSDMFIYGGGGILGGGYRQILSWISKILLAKMLHKITVIYAVGVDYDFHRKLKMLKKIVINKAVDHVSVRDEKSKKILEDMGIKRVYLTPDPALCLEPANPLRVEEILHEEKILPFSYPLIGICLRGTYLGQLFSDEMTYNQFKEIFATIIDYLINKLNAKVVFIPMRYTPSDNKIAFEILEKVQYKERVHIITREYKPQEIMGILGKMDMVIGMRLHSLILAAAMSVPIIGIVYDPKVKNFLLQLNPNVKFCEIRDFNLDDLKTKIEITWQNKEKFKNFINSGVLNLKKMIINNTILVCNLLKCKYKL